MANNDVLKISSSELAALAAKMKEKAKKELQIAQHASPYIPQERPREGVGGTNEHPFDDFGNDRNPPVINPATGKPEWAGTNQGMTIAGNPSFDIGPGHKPASKKAKGFNKTRNNPNDKEVEMIKKWLGGPQLPDVSGASSRQIRDRLKPFTSGGPSDYDKEGGSLRGVPNPLRIQLLRDAKA
tara:strand:- start:49 stop:597 length:549 start_codon:yes stop_codon:yes gene_type:complete